MRPGVGDEAASKGGFLEVIATLGPIFDAVAVRSIEAVLGHRARITCIATPHVAAKLAPAVAEFPADLVQTITVTDHAEAILAVNEAIRDAQSEYVALASSDVEFFPDTITRIVKAIESDSSADLIYTDSIGPSSETGIDGPIRRPDFSPERLQSQMYLGPLCVFKRTVLVGLLDTCQMVGGTELHELALCASERSMSFFHLAETTYGQKEQPGYESLVAGTWSSDATLAMINGRLEQINSSAQARQGIVPGTFRIFREVVGNPLVSIVIPTRGGVAAIRGHDRCLVVEAVRGIVELSTYDNYEFVIIADDETPAEVVAELGEIAGARLRIVPWKAAFNFSAKMNLGVIHARGEYILMLNDDVELITPDWLETLIGLVQRPAVGLVGALLYFEDGTIQHGGHTYVGGGAGHNALGWSRSSRGPLNDLAIEREAVGVTAACAMVSRDLYFELGGLSNLLPSNYNDVDFCMKVTGAGRYIIWTPYVELFHFESKTRNATVTTYELDQLHKRWSSRLQKDAYWPTA